MARAPLIRSDESPYHVTARANNKERFAPPLDTVWQVMASHFQTVTDRFSAGVQAFVLMPNHVHLLIWTPKANLDEIMQHWMREVSKDIGRASGRINHVFGGSYHRCLIDDDAYLSQVYRYVYRNPVKGRLSETAQGYRYSTLALNHVRQGLKKVSITDTPDQRCVYIPEDQVTRLDWINEPYTDREWEAIRRGLKKPRFLLPTGNGFLRAFYALSAPRKY